MPQQKAIVIGAGIVGLATARALSGKGFKVTVIERTHKAVGASIRNFGMVWPVGQPSGTLYERALRSRSIWKEISDAGAFWHDPVGSFHLAYQADEWDVLQELHAAYGEERGLQLLTPSAACRQSEAVQEVGCKGALFSKDEVIVDPREAIAALPGYLEEKYGVHFIWGKAVTGITSQTVHVGQMEQHQADLVFVCSGADFETLYPEVYAAAPLTKCKLQMMRMSPQPGHWRIGPALCGGLSLIHYKSFQVAPSLAKLKTRYEAEMAEYLKWGIHVMVSQNREGALTVGDSHEYGLTLDPFDRDSINTLILDYLKSFARFKEEKKYESWNGVYAKATDGSTELFLNPEPGVYILNALGGAGMTLSFGLAEEKITSLL